MSEELSTAKAAPNSMAGGRHDDDQDGELVGATGETPLERDPDAGDAAAVQPQPVSPDKEASALPADSTKVEQAPGATVGEGAVESTGEASDALDAVPTPDCGGAPASMTAPIDGSGNPETAAEPATSGTGQAERPPAENTEALSDASDSGANDGPAAAPESVLVQPTPSTGDSEAEDQHAAAEPAETSEPSTEPDADDLLIIMESADSERVRLKAIIEAVIYITDEPLSLQQIAGALGKPIDQVRPVLDELATDYGQPDRGLSIREVAGGYKMATKPEHHEEIRTFVKNLKPPLKLSLAALETLAVIAYKQPITAPEIMEIRGVQGAGVLKTLLDRKLIATAGRKNVIGKPILYKTTKEFLVQFGLKDLSELPTLKEFEELGRLALSDADAEPGEPAAPAAVHEPGHTPVAPAFDPESAPVESGTVELDEELPSGEPSDPPTDEPPVEEPGPEPPRVDEPPAEVDDKDPEQQNG